MNLLKTESRDLSFSRGELMKFRKQGKIPSVIYGGKTGSTPVFVSEIEFEKIFAADGKVFQIEVGGKKQMVNAKEIQKNPLGTMLLHISFHELTKGEKTIVNVPVQVTGDAPGVKAGGTIAIISETLALKVLPSKVPHHVEVDVSALNMGDHILAKDIKLPEGAEFDQDVDPEGNVIICNHPQKVVEEAPAAAPEAEAEAKPEEESKE